jgi:hypothetical protein
MSLLILIVFVFVPMIGAQALVEQQFSALTTVLSGLGASPDRFAKKKN